jgi:hypothetical protein
MPFIPSNVSGVQGRTLFMKRHAHNLQEHLDVRTAGDKVTPALSLKRDVIRSE